ncbi:hypothetical protein [Nocardia sp. NPDC004711]
MSSRNILRHQRSRRRVMGSALNFPTAAPAEVAAVAGLAELARRLDWEKLPDLADQARAIARKLGYDVHAVPNGGAR